MTPAIGGVDDRLVVEVQLAAADRSGQAARQAGLVPGEVQPAQVKDVVSSDPVALCAVHRQIGVAQELLGRIDPLAGERDPDAGAQRHLDVRERERPGELGVEPDRDRVGGRGVGEVLAQDHELVTGQAGQAVTGPQQPGQPLGDRHQQLVADLMAVGVVDLLEPIEIHEEHRRDLLRAPPRAKRVLEQLQHQHPIGQAGQGIVQRRFARLVRGILEIGARLRVDQIRRRDVRQRLRCDHRLRATAAPRVSRYRSSAPSCTSSWRNGNVNTAASPDSSARGANAREAILESQIRDRDARPGVVGRKARPLAQLGLQLLIAQRRRVDAATYRGSSPGAISVTPAAVIGRMSTIRLTR